MIQIDPNSCMQVEKEFLKYEVPSISCVGEEKEES